MTGQYKSSSPSLYTNVMIVDDRQILQRLLSTYFTGVFNTIPFSDAKEAIKEIEKQHIDLLLTDISMPGAKGSEIASKLLEKNPNAAIVYMTGHAETDDEVVEVLIKKTAY